MARLQPQRFEPPTPQEQMEFLFRLCFGADTDRLHACVDLAYLDLSRTLHGFGKLPNAEGLRTQAKNQVRSALAVLPRLQGNMNQDAFDAWHRATCTTLCSAYAKHKFPSFAIGQAQKWINMAFKYIYVFGEERLPGFTALYALGHVPLDNVMLNQLRHYGAPPISSAWSRLRDYDEYLAVQRWIRTTFAESAPLAVEFHLWQALDS